MSFAQLQRFWLKALLFVLWGYALLGRGFANFYLGELLLVSGIGLFFLSRRLMNIFHDPVLFLWGLFAAWGVCRTLPFVGVYHFDAIRDSVLYGYGFFMLLIFTFVDRGEIFVPALRGYSKFLRWFLPLIPLIVVIGTVLHVNFPPIPWAGGQGLIQAKAGDAAVHLVPAALFLLLFSDRTAHGQHKYLSISRALCVAGWFACFAIVVAISRGGSLAILLALGLASALEFKAVGSKLLLLGMSGAATGVMLLFLNPFSFQIKGAEVGPELIGTMLSSMVGSGDNTRGHQGTKEFRLIWWGHIIRDTGTGHYRWTGRGFGINLASEYGPPDIDLNNTSLRSPHNGSMTVLARMGLPGIALWAAINFVFGARMLAGYFRARRYGLHFWRRVNLIALCYWLAALVNMSFDVYVEGPQGGIWFWVMMGVGITALKLQKKDMQLARVTARRASLVLPTRAAVLV